MRIVRRETVAPAMESLTCYKANKIKVRMRTVKRNTAAPAMESLTVYQANRTRGRVGQ